MKDRVAVKIIEEVLSSSLAQVMNPSRWICCMYCYASLGLSSSFSSTIALELVVPPY